MKKSIIAVAFAALSFGAFAADSHSNYVGSVNNLKDTLVVTDAKAVADIIKYTDVKTKAALLKAYNEDGKLTAAEIKASGISDHHFYTGYLSSAKNQSEYDAKLKELNGGKNVDDNFISNRDLKAHGSMLMNQVDGKINFATKTQDGKMQAMNDHYTNRMDKIVQGMKDLGSYVSGETPALNAGQKVFALKDKDGNVVQGLVGYEYTKGKNGEVVMGYEVIKNDFTFFDQNGNKVTLQGAGDKYDALKGGLDNAMNGRPEGSPEFGVDRPLSSEAITQIAEAVKQVNSKVDAIVSGLQNADWSSVGGGSSGEVGQKVDALIDYIKEKEGFGGVSETKFQAMGEYFQAQAAHTASEIARLDGRIDSLEKKTDKLKAGVAGANAIGSLTQYTGNGTHHVAVGLGGYEGASALAGGYTYAVSANTTVRVTVAYDSEGDFGYGASVGHSW